MIDFRCPTNIVEIPVGAVHVAEAPSTRRSRLYEEAEREALNRVLATASEASKMKAGPVAKCRTH